MSLQRSIILVVEDDPELRRLYRDVLSLSGGYAVIAVEDGIEALRRIETDMPAAVVLDIGLPRLSGRDVEGELAAHPSTRNIPIVVVSGNTETIDQSRYACVLRKPVDVQDLLEAVRSCLRKARLRKDSLAP